MIVKEILDIYEILDSAYANGEKVADYLRSIGGNCEISVSKLEGKGGKSTDVIKVMIPGSNGKSKGGSAPTIGLLGRLGGLGARPERIGFVSDGDGALTVLAAAAKLLKMQREGDLLEGDVLVSTHVCPDAPTLPHKPVSFMNSPVSMQQMNQSEVDGSVDAILSVDTTKGNRIMNHKGFSISPTVDITPYGNDLYHLNSILQPSTATDVPVVGVAITTETTVPGCATGATNLMSIDEAGRFVLEVAKEYTKGTCGFYDQEEYQRIQKLYGSMSHLRTFGNKKE